MADEWTELDFDGALATLQGWLGHVIRVSIETGHPDRPISQVHAAGILRASNSIFDPQGWFEDEYPFELHPAADNFSGFTLDKSTFHSATRRDDALLIVCQGEPVDNPAKAPQLYIVNEGAASSSSD